MPSKRTSVSETKTASTKKQPQVRVKTREEHYLILLMRLGALVKGFKIRRILNHSRVVQQLKKEYSDMMKFAY